MSSADVTSPVSRQARAQAHSDATSESQRDSDGHKFSVSSKSEAAEEQVERLQQPPPHSTQTSTSRTPFPTTLSDLQFPQTSLSTGAEFYSTLKALRLSTLSIHNRLTSILSDSLFVTAVSRHYALPLVANERCGSWYIPPSLKRGSVYFKSTDGHHGQWSFSLRRLNLQLLKILGREGGAVVVDSTRRGKAVSDALGKTVPMWVAVVNRVLFPERGVERGWHELRLGREVGGSERSQIEQRIEGWCEGFRGLGLDLEELRRVCGRPIRVSWAVNEEWDDEEVVEEKRIWEEENLLVLCSASRRVTGAEISEGGYIQGAGDDSEGWSSGLTPTVFWANKSLLLETTEEDLPGLIERLLREEGEMGQKDEAVLIRPTTNIYLGVGSKKSDEGFDLVINCNGDNHSASPKILGLKCREGKLGSKDLRDRLGAVKSVVATTLERRDDCRVLITCSTGRDIGVGVAVVLLCCFFDDSGQARRVLPSPVIDKAFVKRRLAWITNSKPDANPSRSTLQAVNSFLMARPS